MKPHLLEASRAVAEIISTRIQIVIPAILAEGETFAARIVVVGADGLPRCPRNDWLLRFENCLGIAGLPKTLKLDTQNHMAVLENLTATSEGVALICATVANSATPSLTPVVRSNPAWIFKEPPHRLFWGDLHVHTTYSNCSAWRCLDPEWCYEYARDIALLDFAAPADHLRGIASDPARWPRLQALARAYNTPNRFVSFLAFESSHAQGYGGDNNVYFLDDDAPYFWLEREDMRGIAPQVSLKTLWEYLDRCAKDYFTAPHHTGRAQKYRAWTEDYYDPVREPLFEIYSSWGSSEMRHTRLPISGGNNDAPSYFVDALQAGARFGVIAASDDHATLPGAAHHFRIDPYCDPTLNGHSHKGLAAVYAPALTRRALFAALRQRHTYASTHSRSLIALNIAGIEMGEEIPADTHLAQRRVIRIRFTLHNAAAAHIVLMRNGQEFARKSLRGKSLATSINEVVFDDTNYAKEVAIRGAKFHPEPFLVYYARIEDNNGDHQWTSPIWINLGD